MLQFCSINCNFLHFLAITCNSVQLLAILCNNLQFRAIAFNFLQYLAEYCATSCNLVITCNYILLFASSRSWILLNLVSSLICECIPTAIHPHCIVIYHINSLQKILHWYIKDWHVLFNTVSIPPFSAVNNQK